MASLYDLPDMGESYGNLARLEAPVMMPNAPVGAGGMAGQMYYQDKARQDESFSKASQLAELQAQIKAQAADEYGAAAPGRMSTINTNNSMAQNKEANLPTLLDTQNNETQTANIKSRADKQKQVEETLYPFANDYASGVRGEDLKDKMRAAGISKIGTRNLEDVPDDKLHSAMEHLREKQIHTPAQIQKVEVENAKGTNRLNVEDLKGSYGLLKESMRQEARVKVANLIKEGKESGKQWIQKYYDAVDAGENTELQDQMYLTITKNATYRDWLRGSQAAPQINPDIVNTPGQPDVLKKPPVGDVTSMPKAKIETEGGYTISGTEATGKDGKKYKVTGHDKATGEYWIDGVGAVKAKKAK